jgi:hypothetical protein
MSQETGPGSQQQRDDSPADEAIEGRGDEGARAEQVTPPIADDAQAGQTQSESAPEDVGVPSDEELSEEGAAEGD